MSERSNKPKAVEKNILKLKGLIERKNELLKRRIMYSALRIRAVRQNDYLSVHYYAQGVLEINKWLWRFRGNPLER